MNPDDKINVDTITISLDDIKPQEFQWIGADMSAGITAQSIDTVTIGAIGANGATGTTSYSSIGISTGTYDDFGPTRKEHNELIERVQKLEKIMAEEAEIRANHPAVKNAYDEYRLLLVLAKQHTTNVLTDE